MSRIYWDTMLFVYWLEEHPRYVKRIRHLLDKMHERQDQLHTSSFAVGEILVGFYKTGAAETARKVRGLFRPPFVEVVDYTLETADIYANIRATQRVSPPDAIHLACAVQARTDLFLTNDIALVGKVVPGIQFIASLDTPLL